MEAADRANLFRIPDFHDPTGNCPVAFLLVGVYKHAMHVSPAERVKRWLLQ